MPAGTDFVLYFNIAFFGVIGLGMLIGFLKGFKRSIFSFITTVIYYVVFFFTIDLAVNLLWTYQVPQLGSWVAGFMPQLSTITSLSQAVPILLESFLGDMLGAAVSNAQLLLLVNGLAIFAVKIVWTLLYFTIIWVIYKLICALIFSLFFHSRKVDQKYASKNRGLGAVFGLLEGTVSVFVSLIMLGGLISVCESLVGFVPAETEDAPAELVFEMPRQTFYEASYSVIPVPQETAFEIPAEISTYITMLEDMVTAYNTNIVVTTANLATMTDQNQAEVPLNLYLFDEVLSFDYQANASDPEAVAVKVSIRKELAVFAEIAAVVLSKDISSGNVAQMGITREDITTVFTKLSESDLITSIIPLGIEISAQFLETDLEIPVADLYEIAWKEEIADLGLIVATVYEIADSVGFFEEGGIDYETVELDAELIDEFFTSLADSELVTLAAFVAVEPLMAMAGEQINAVITVPADMDWSAEFLAIGSIVAEVLASDASIGDIMSADYTVLALALTEVDFVILLNSKLVTNAMINVLSGNSGIPGLEFLEIPEGTIWLDQLDDEGNIIAHGELHNILLALNAVLNLASGISDLNDVMSDPSQLLGTIGDMTDADIDAIFGSGILVATLSTMILDLELGEFALVVPDDVYDVNGYILKSEFVSVAHAARVIATDMACDLEDTECATTGFDISKALNLSDDSIDTLLTSEIIAASVGKLVYDMAGDPLVVPLIATETLVVDAADMVVVSDAEIRKVFKAVSAIGIDDINNIELNASILDNLAEPTDPLLLSEIDAADADDLDDAKINNVFGSDILLATIADVLIDLTTGVDSLIVIPYKDVNGVDVRTMDLEGIEYISVAELKNVLNALLSLDITDFENMDSLDLNLIITNSSVLLNSAILHATVSKQLFDLGSDMITIPYFDQDGNAIRITVGTGEQTTTYLAKSELEAAFDALDVLNITDINNFDGTFDMSSLTEEGNVTILLGSAVIHATVSTMLFDMTEGAGGAEAVLDVPYFDQDENPIRITVGDVGADTDTTYLDKDEIEAIVDALDVFDITDLESFDGTFDMSALTTEGNIEILLQSAVIHATVSKTLFDMTEGLDATLEIPYFNDLSEPIRVDVGDPVASTDTEYLKKTEIEAIIDGLDVFGITDIESFDGSFDMSALTTEGNIAILLRSAVIHATVSKTLFDMTEGLDATLEIPYFNDLNQPIRVTVGSIAEATDTEYLLDTEIEAIIDGLDVFGITDIESFDGSFDMTALTTEGNIAILLRSAVIHATVSKTLFDMTEGVDATLEIPFFNDLDQPIRVNVGSIAEGTDTEYLLDTEIEAIIDGLDVFGITDIESFDGSFDMTALTEEGNIAILLQSAVIHATVSKTLFDMTEGINATLEIPFFNDLDQPIRVNVGSIAEGTDTEYLLDTEIEAIIDGLDVFGIQDIESFDGSFDMTALTTEGNIEILLRSAVIHATVSKTLFDMTEGVDATLEIPYFNDLNAPIRVNVGDIAEGTDTEYLLDTEIEAIIDGLDVFGITDIESFDGTFDMSALTTEGNIEILLRSAVIHATVSKTLFDMTEGVDATLEIPYFNDLSQPIRVNVGNTVEGTDTEYLLDTEIEAIIDGLDVFGITDIESFDGTFDMSALTLPGNIQILLASATIHATVSKTLFDMGVGEDATLTIPYFDQDDVAIRFTVGSTLEGTDTEYLLDTEIEAIVDGLDVFGIADIDSFTGSFDMTALTVPGNVQILLTSATIHATISRTLFDMTIDDPLTLNTNEATLNIPYYDALGVSIRKTVGAGLTQTDYLTKSEIEAIVDGLNVFGITDINNFNGTFNMSALTVPGNVTILLTSATIHATISDTLFSMSEGEDATLTIPHFDELGVSIRATVGAGLFETVYLNKLEIQAIVDGLNVFGITNIDNFDGTFDMTALTVEGNIEILLTSSTIQATISKTLLDMSIDDPLTLADEATLSIPYYDEDSDLIRATVGVELDGTQTVYLLKTEISALVDALNIFGIADINNFNGNFDMTRLTADGNIEILLASATIHATISDTLFAMTSLSIPYYDAADAEIRETVGIGLEATAYLLKTEIIALVDALDVLEMTDLDSFGGTFDMTKLTADGNIDILLASATIHATISDTLLDMGTGAGSTLVVPYFTQLGVSIRAVVGEDEEETIYLIKAEIIAIVDALDVLQVTTLDDFAGAFNMNLLTAPGNIAILLDSTIIHATISDTLIGMASLEIPYFDQSSSAIILEVGNPDPLIVTEDTTYILDTEIEDLVSGLDVFGVTDLDDFSGTFDMATLTGPGNMTILLGSAIIHATISDTLLGMASLTIPYFDESTADIRITVGVVMDGTDTEYVDKVELNNLVAGLDALGMTNLDSFTGTFDLASLTTGDNLTTMLASAIIHASISDTLLGMASLTIPYFDESTAEIRITVGIIMNGTDTEYVNKAELSNLVAGLDALGMTNLDDFTGTFDLASLTEGDNLTTMLSSAIIHASISETLLGLGSVTIPYFDEVGGIIIKNVGVFGSTETLYVTKAELNVLVDALDILGISDINSFTGTVSFTNLFINNNLGTVLLSSIIQATVSEQMFDLETGDTINIPATNIGGTAMVLSVGDTLENTDTVYVKRTEIQFFFEAMHMLAPANDDVGDFSGNFSLTILATLANQNILLASATMHATISETLDELADGVLIIPETNQLDADIKKTVSEVFVVESEIKALINAFLAMGFADLNSFGGSISSEAFFAETATLLLSASIQATISDKMLNGTGGVLIIPDADSLLLATIRFVHVDVTLIDKDEISEIMAVLEAMGLTDFSTMDFNPANIFAMDYDVLLASASMRATVSDTLLDVAADETAAAGFSGLIVPLAKRESILVNALAFTQIESVELRALLESLEMLGIGDFSANFNPLIIMSMTELELNDLLDSGSIHVTIDKMLKGNANVGSTILIPTQALFTMYDGTLHPIAGVITKAELVAFIRAVQTLGGTDFTTFNLDPIAIIGLNEADRAIVVTSMIVRNSINESLEVAINIENGTRVPFGPFFTINAEDYMEDNTALFFTYEDEIEALKFLNDDAFTD